MQWLFSYDVTTKGTTKFLSVSIFVSSSKTNRQGKFRGDKCFHSQTRLFEFDPYRGRAIGKQRIGSCLACVYRVMDARGKCLESTKEA